MNGVDARNRFAFPAALVLLLLGAGVVDAQETLPPGTNPTQRVIYAGEGQTEQQQLEDQLACYRWATQQTGWDPYEAHAKLVEQGHVAQQTAEEAQGGLIRGAARGAVAGVAIGAIAGDAGKGAAIGAAAGGLVGGSRSRRTQQGAQGQAEAAVEAFNQQLGTWDRNYVACLQGRDYVVN
jgi:hypothetical protein